MKDYEVNFDEDFNGEEGDWDSEWEEAEDIAASSARFADDDWRKKGGRI